MKKIPYEKYPLSRIVTIYEIISADYLCNPHVAELTHIHQEAWELCYCISGNLIYYKDKQSVLLHSGEIAFVCPGTAHDSQINQQHTTAFFISFTCSSNYIKILKDSVITITPLQKKLFRQIISELELAFKPGYTKQRRFHFVPSKHSPVGAEQLICCYLEQIIIDILREITKQDGVTVQNQHFPKAVNCHLAANISTYIRNHLEEPLTVKKIAAEFHYSRSRLSTIYKSVTGIGIHEFIVNERLEKAKSLLLERRLTVTQISEQLGFASPQYFSRKFAQTVGCPPSQYADRKNNASL